MSKAEQLLQQVSNDEAWRKFDVLPESVRTTILAPKTLDILYAIGENNNLRQEQINKLVRYTDVILAGIVPIKLFRNTLQEELQLDEDAARKVATEVRDKIFMAIKDELRRIHNLM